MDFGGSIWTVLAGSVVAFEVEILALTFLMKMIKMAEVFNFSYYCCATGMRMIIL
jgi:undecaprenyl pyrophosphate phosphatase UppP